MQREQFLIEVTKARRECDYATAAELIRAYQAAHPESADSYVESGHVEYDRNRLDLAADYIDQALTVSPSDDRALGWKVALLDVRGGPEDAVALAEMLLAENADLPAVRVALGRTYQRQGHKEQALIEYEQALQVAPAYLDAVEWRIEVIGRLHGYQAALAEVWPAAERFQNAPELFVAAYAATASLEEKTQGQETLERALKIHSACVPPLRMKIDWLISTGRLDEAVARADDALLLAPAAGSLHLARGRARFYQGRFAASVESFRRASELEPYQASRVTWLVSALKRLERHEEVGLVIEQALRRMPQDVSLLSAAAAERARQGDFDAAFLFSSRMIQAAPSDIGAVRRHLTILLDRHRYAEAEQVALGAARNRPKDAAFAAEVARIYGRLDRDEDALAWFRTAMELSGGSGYATDVAKALGWLNRFAEAESLLLSAIEAKPGSAVLHDWLGYIREEAGNFSGALDAYERTIELDPLKVNSRIAQIALLCRLRRLEEAEAAARSALELIPGSGELREARTWPLRDDGRESDVESALRQALEECEGLWKIRVGLVQSLYRQGKFNEALDEVAEMLDDDPHDRVAHRWKASLLEETRGHGEAIIYIENLVRQYPDDLDMRVSLGWRRYNTGDFLGALADFEAACAMRPTVWATRSRVNALCRLRRFAEAEGLLRDEIRSKPNYAMLRHELAWTYWIQGQQKKALAECGRAWKVELGPVAGATNYVLMLRRHNHWDEAERVLEKALSRYPGDPSLLVQFGLLLDDQNRYAEAIDWFDSALEVSPIHHGALVAKSATLRSLGRFAEAEVTLEPALQRSPNASELLVERGWIYRDQGRLIHAKQTFERVADTAPGPAVRADARRCLGWTAFADDKYDEARRLFGAVLAEDPHFIDAKIGLAWSLVRLDDLENDQTAEQLCLEVLAVDPRNHLAHTCIGVLYARQRDFPLAEYHLRNSLELDPFDGSFVDLAVLLIDLERFDEAEDLLAKALDRDWYDIQAHIAFGRLHLQRDIDSGAPGVDARQAATHFRQALTLDPTSPAAATGLAVTLSRLPGDLAEGEHVMRRVIGHTHQDDVRWPLLLTLARLLIERGDAGQRPELYLEAVALAQDAIDLASVEAEPYYVAGVAAFKAGSQKTDARLISLYRSRSVRYLKLCLKRDSTHEEARRVLMLAEQSAAVASGSLAGSRALTWISALLLVGLWAGFFLTDKINAVVLGTMTAVLASLFALGFVLPHLVRLKLPGGVEADLSASLAQVSAGPTGELNIGRGRFAGTNMHFDSGSSFNTGPRGELPRLGAGPDERIM